MYRPLPVVLLLLVLAGDARASCIPPNPRQSLKYADAAFDGRFESDRFDGHLRRLTFRVDRVVKGELAGTVEVRDDAAGSSIAFGRFTAGERIGLMMNFKDGEWLSNSCHQSDPDELADAVKPIPRPPGRGIARYLVTGVFGDAHAVLLDRRGRTLAYGFGGARDRFSGGSMSVCPGGRRIVRLTHRRLSVLRTRDLRVMSGRTIPHAASAHCLGRRVVLARGSGLFRGGRRIWSGRANRVAFHGRRAFAVLDRSVVRVDLVTGRARTVASFELPPEHEPLYAVAVAPGGRRLALLLANHSVRPGEPASKLATVDLAVSPPRVRTIDLEDSDVGDSVAWLDDERFALLPFRPWRGGAVSPPGATRLYDVRLRSRGDVPGWTTGFAMPDAGGLLGLTGHRLERATPAGGVSEVGRLPGSDAGGLLRLPDVEIRASRRVPRY